MTMTEKCVHFLHLSAQQRKNGKFFLESQIVWWRRNKTVEMCAICRLSQAFQSRASRNRPEDKHTPIAFRNNVIQYYNHPVTIVTLKVIKRHKNSMSSPKKRKKKRKTWRTEQIIKNKCIYISAASSWRILDSSLRRRAHSVRFLFSYSRHEIIINDLLSNI